MQLINSSPVPIVIIRGFPYWAMFPRWAFFHWGRKRHTTVQEVSLWWGAN